jgi:hypothetical protein
MLEQLLLTEQAQCTYTCNIVPRWSSHCYRCKAMCITYSEYVSVAFGRIFWSKKESKD